MPFRRVSIQNITFVGSKIRPTIEFKSWSELVRKVARSAVDELAKGKDLPYPSPDDTVETFKKIGESIRNFPFNTET